MDTRLPSLDISPARRAFSPTPIAQSGSTCDLCHAGLRQADERARVAAFGTCQDLQLTSGVPRVLPTLSKLNRDCRRSAASHLCPNSSRRPAFMGRPSPPRGKKGAGTGADIHLVWDHEVTSALLIEHNLYQCRSVLSSRRSRYLRRCANFLAGAAPIQIAGLSGSCASRLLGALTKKPRAPPGAQAFARSEIRTCRPFRTEPRS
jgi:hypothetical protein